MTTDKKHETLTELGKSLQKVNHAPRQAQQRGQVEWVPLETVLPNPLNPRKNDAIRSQDMQNILNKRGWEEPLTVYRRGQHYILLAGHRRLYAAGKAKVREIPVFIVDAPKTMQEEIERLASLQAGRVNWEPIEWATHTYERWLAWGRPSINRFSKEIGLAKRTVEQYIMVLDYFPMDEIEATIKNGQTPIYILAELVVWIKDLKKYQPSLVESFDEVLIRRAMLDKLARKKVAQEALRKREAIVKIKSADMKKFIADKEMALTDLLALYEVDVTEKSFHSSLVSMGYAKKNVKALRANSKEEAKKAVETLSELAKNIENQLKEIERKFPDTIEKEDLFTWKKH